MKAAVFHKPGDALTIETVPQPTISDRLPLTSFEFYLSRIQVSKFSNVFVLPISDIRVYEFLCVESPRAYLLHAFTRVAVCIFHLPLGSGFPKRVI